ncbi:Epidermal retinol dehydrogenase 2 [Hondaea fermentalgiana]|uniref:Short-chain dehydrogenase/reductase 3 n=1 Tax=Hondaea fermentalgiana TaxID=2315210 RepID=A0A2R5GMH5_9STRA|nr:Epidermal retinol dehydrogenase 2 [Hondaea fermentalgiana]|eukprot:GBG32080.1 Epidermal retinol dehydrogenase 2 [Hondaea fermentalgiana]
MSEIASFVGDFLPRPPKRWALLAGAVAAYYGLREVAPHLFEKSINGDVVVITGGGSGIGRLMALRVAKEGCSVAILDVNKEGADKVAEECKALGATARSYLCDVTNRSMVYEVAAQVEKDFGHVDIVVNNAGIVGGKKLIEADDDRMELVLKVNTHAILWVTKAFLPGMIRRNHGHVVIIASSAGRVGVPNMVAYNASKFGAVGAGEGIRLEMQKMGTKIKCTTVCPMYIATGMFEGAKLQPRYKFLEGPVNALFPILEPDYVADQIINAVKRDQELLVMPAMAYSTTIMQGLLPTAVTDRILEDLGVSSSMDHFKQTRA